MQQPLYFKMPILSSGLHLSKCIANKEEFQSPFPSPNPCVAFRKMQILVCFRFLKNKHRRVIKPKKIKTYMFCSSTVVIDEPSTKRN